MTPKQYMEAVNKWATEVAMQEYGTPFAVPILLCPEEGGGRTGQYDPTYDANDE